MITIRSFCRPCASPRLLALVAVLSLSACGAGQDDLEDSDQDNALVGTDQAKAAATNQPGCAAGAICRAEAPKVTDLDRNGPYRVRQFTLRSGRNHGGADVFYPVDAKPPFAYAVYCPPYTATRAAFAAWGPFFASHGIVLATMDSVTIGDYPPQRAEGLEELMATLRSENGRRDSPLSGKLDEQRGGVLGWSMGGGGVWIDSGKHPEWKSAVTLAGHNATATGWESSARRSTIPTLMLNGATDVTILGGLGQSEAAYEAIPDSTPKLLYVFSTLGHFDWGSPGAGRNAVGRYVMAWEKTFLEGDERYRPFLLEEGPFASTWESNLEQLEQPAEDEDRGIFGSDR